MDTQTLFFAIAIAYGVFTVMILIVERPASSLDPLALLAFGFACISVGVVLQSMRGSLPTVVSIFAGNIVVWIGLAYQYSAIRSITESPIARRARIPALTGMVAIALVCWVLPSRWQVAVVSAVYAILYAAAGSAVARWEKAPALPRWFMGGGFILAALLYLLRGIDAARGTITSDVFAPGGADLATVLLYPVLFLLALTTGFGLLLMSKRAADARIAQLLHEQQTTLETLPTGLLIVQGRQILQANPAMERMLGAEPGSLVGQSGRILYPDDEEFDRIAGSPYRTLATEGHFAGEAMFQRRSGDSFPVWMESTRLEREGDVTHAVVSITDIGELKTLQNELSRQASYDDLTGLANRRNFILRAQAEVARAHRTHEPLSLAIFDLDQFKQINDDLGHAAGDAALRIVADACRSTFREMDVVARFGGDEFAVALPGNTLEQAAAAIARLQQALKEHPLELDGRRIPVGASFGVVDVALDETLDGVLARADAAMYESKAMKFHAPQGN